MRVGRRFFDFPPGTEMLVEQAQHGNKESEEQLIYLLIDAAQWYLLRMDIPHEDVNDESSKIVTKLYKNFSRYKEEGKFSQWFATSIHRAKINYFRDNREQGNTLSYEDLESHEFYIGEHREVRRETEEQAFQHIEHQTKMKIIELAIEQMTPNERQVFFLKIEGTTNEEIARILHIETGAVKSRLHRAWEWIRRIARKTGYDYE